MTARRRNERGIALLSVLGILAVLLVLAAVVANGSRVESALSGTSKQGARALAAADAGLGFALGDADNFINPAFTCSPVLPRCTDIGAAGLPLIGDVCVCFDHEGPPPTTIKVSALKFKAFHFDMDATGTVPPTAEANLEMTAVRLGPAQ